MENIKNGIHRIVGCNSEVTKDTHEELCTELYNFVESKLINCFIPAVVGRSEQLGCHFCGTEDGKHGWTDDGEVCPLDRTA